MNTIFTLMVCTIFFTSCAPNTINRASKEVEKRTRVANYNKHILNFNDVRARFLKQDKAAAHLLSKFDTLYILDQYTVEDGTFYCKMWCENFGIDYQYRVGKFTQDSINVFTKYMCTLVQRWDTLNLRKEENLYSNSIPIHRVYASRIVRNKKNITVDVINFKSFFKIDRDRD